MAKSTQQARFAEVCPLVQAAAGSATAGVSEVEGNWMAPTMKAGDLIRYDQSLQPRTGDIVVARATCGMVFMGTYANGYRHGEFVVRPERGEPANSLRDPIEVMAAVTHHLRTFRRPSH